MRHDRPREDLTNSWPGEIGQRVLWIACALRQKGASVSHAFILGRLIDEIDKVAGRLYSLKDPDPLESQLVRYLELLQKELYHLKNENTLLRRDTDRRQAADRLEEFGAHLYEYRFDSENPPDSLERVADELRVFQDLVRVHGLTPPLVTLHGAWIAEGICLLLSHKHSRSSDEMSRRIRDRLSTVMTALEGIASYEREDCLDLLAGTIEFLSQFNPPERHIYATQSPHAPEPQSGQSEEITNEDGASETQDDSATARRDEPQGILGPSGFIFEASALARYQGVDLELPAGACVEVLNALVDKLGGHVGYANLNEIAGNPDTPPTEASDALRGHIRAIRRALENHRIPCQVNNYRSHGYGLVSTTARSESA